MRENKNKKQFAGKREMIYKDNEGQDYAIVKSLSGDCRIRATCCSDAVERVCHIRGKMKKKIWIKVGDVILIAFREFQEDKCDVIHKYSDEEAKMLRKQGEIRTAMSEVLDTIEEEKSDDGIEFDMDAQHEEINLEDL